MADRTKFHDNYPEFHVENMTRDEALAGMCVLDALFNLKKEGYQDAYEYLNEDQGSYETRDEALAMGVAIERAYKTLSEESEGSAFQDQITEHYGCYDFEFIPAMVSACIDNPEIDFVTFIREELKKASKGAAA